MRCKLHREVVEVGAVMTHLPGSPTSRTGAAINHEKEVAGTLNISVAAVKARLYRARVRLLERTSVRSRARKRVPGGVVDTGARKSQKSRTAMDNLRLRPRESTVDGELPVTVAERELRWFVGSVIDLLGSEGSKLLEDIWLDELASMEAMLVLAARS